MDFFINRQPDRPTLSRIEGPSFFRAWRTGLSRWCALLSHHLLIGVALAVFWCFVFLMGYCRGGVSLFVYKRSRYLLAMHSYGMPNIWRSGLSIFFFGDIGGSTDDSSSWEEQLLAFYTTSISTASLRIAKNNWPSRIVG